MLFIYVRLLSPDGNIIANTDDSYQKIKLWDIQTGTYLDCLEDKSYHYHTYLKAFAFSQNSNFLLGVFNYHLYSSKKIVIWDVTGKQTHSIDFFKKKTETSLILNQDGSLLVVFEVPKKLNQPRKMKVMKVPQDYHQPIILVEASTLIDKFKNFIHRLLNPNSLFISSLWTLSYDRITPFPYSQEYRYNIIFSPNKKLIAIQTSISQLEIRKIKTGEVVNIIDINNIVNIDNDQEFPIVLFYPDDDTRLVISIINQITFWDINSGEQIHSINSYRPKHFRVLTFSPDGKILAFTENSLNTSLPHSIKLWDMKARKEIDNFEVTHDRKIMSLNFTGNGKFLISGYSDGKIQVWQRKL